MTDFECLVLAGGGARMIAQAGALRALQRRGALRNVKRVMGTSAGAVLGAAFAVGRDMDDVFLKHVFGRGFKADVSIEALSSRFGLDTGKDLMLWIRQVLGKAADYTFEQILAEKGIHLEVVASNMSKNGEATYFGPQTSPKLSVASALRMSCSIPFFFASVQHEDGDVFIDGAVVDNFPVRHAIESCPGIDPAKILGIRAENNHAPRALTLRSFAEILASVLTRSEQVAGVSLVSVPACKGVSCGVTDFTSLTPKARLKLYLHGSRHSDKWYDAILSPPPRDENGDNPIPEEEGKTR